MAAPVEVRNPVSNYRFLLTGARGTRWLTAAGTVDHDVPDNGDFKLVSYAPPPAWARDAVIYQIFPDRFARSAAADARAVPDWAVPCDWDTPVVGRGPQTPYQFYGGDLDGITERLDHLDRLGVNTVYLTPFFPARSNHRYDAASFDAVDPLLAGTPPWPGSPRRCTPGAGDCWATSPATTPATPTGGSPPQRPTGPRPNGSCTTSTRRPATTSPGTASGRCRS